MASMALNDDSLLAENQKVTLSLAVEGFLLVAMGMTLMVLAYPRLLMDQEFLQEFMEKA